MYGNRHTINTGDRGSKLSSSVDLSFQHVFLGPSYNAPKWIVASFYLHSHLSMSLMITKDLCWSHTSLPGNSMWSWWRLFPCSKSDPPNLWLADADEALHRADDWLPQFSKYRASVKPHSVTCVLILSPTLVQKGARLASSWTRPWLRKMSVSALCVISRPFCAESTMQLPNQAAPLQLQIYRWIFINSLSIPALQKIFHSSEIGLLYETEPLLNSQINASS